VLESEVGDLDRMIGFAGLEGGSVMAERRLIG